MHIMRLTSIDSIDTPGSQWYPEAGLRGSRVHSRVYYPESNPALLFLANLETIPDSIGMVAHSNAGGGAAPMESGFLLISETAS